MALIKCPECGREISDKAISCPGCGCPASEFQKDNVKSRYQETNYGISDDIRYKTGGYHLSRDTAVIETQEDLEMIADDVYAECPNDQYKGVSIFRKRTGVDLPTARNIMYRRYHGATPNELDTKKGMFKFEKKQRVYGSSYCPKCGSTHIRPYQGIEWIATYPKIFGWTFIHRSENKKKLECLYCGYVWNAYKIN